MSNRQAATKYHALRDGSLLQVESSLCGGGVYWQDWQGATTLEAPPQARNPGTGTQLSATVLVGSWLGAIRFV